MLKRKYFFVFIFTHILYSALGQQDPQFSQNMFNQMAINPGYAGSQDMVCINALYKQQWMGFGEGSPATNAVNINSSIKPFGIKSGVGLSILNDRIGFNNDLGLNLSYALRIKTDKGMLGIGASGGFVNNVINPTWKAGTLTDVAIPAKKESSVNLDLGFGLFFNTESMYFGASATHLNQAQLYNSTNGGHYVRHYYLTGGYLLDLPNPSWQVGPSVFIASDLVKTQFTLTSTLKYNKKFWGGVSYRIGEAFTAMLGLELFNGLKVGYAYDYSTSPISGYNSGSHELMLGYSFTLKKERPPQQYKSIRFL